MVDYVKSSHGYGWLIEGAIGGQPSLTGSIELYRPLEDGTEDMADDAVFDVEFHGEYDDLDEAIGNIDCLGRWMISTPGEDDYIGYLNSVQGSVGLKLYPAKQY